MVASTDSQLRTVWVAADRVPFEKRGVFIEVARLQLTRADLDDAVRAALTGANPIGGLMAHRRFPPPMGCRGARRSKRQMWPYYINMHQAEVP